MLTYKINAVNNKTYSEQEIQKALDKAFGKNSFQIEKTQNSIQDLINPNDDKNSAKVQPEINDIMQAIQKYLAVNKSVYFIGSFMALECRCKDCSKTCEDEINIKEEASRMFAFGDLEALRNELNLLRDIIEDEVDDDGFVSL